MCWLISQVSTHAHRLLTERLATAGARGYHFLLLAALEELAFRQGHTTVCLETGTYLPAAIGLYRSCGYQPVPVYGEYIDNPYSVCFAKRLPVAA